MIGLKRNFSAAFARSTTPPALICAVLLIFATSASAKRPIPNDLQDVGIEPTLGASIPGESIELLNEKGEKVLFSKYLNQDRPVLLSLMYYRCPTLCTFVVQGMVNSLNDFQWNVGEKFDVVVVSIDPTETPSLAAEKKASFIEEYAREGSEVGFHFHTATEENIKKLASSVGFRYRYDKEQDEFAHGAGIFVVTPSGKLSRVLYGVQFKPRDLRLALLEASEGKIGTVLDRIVLYCYQYDPSSKGYSLVAFRVVQVGALVTVLLMGSYFFAYFRRQKRMGAIG